MTAFASLRRASFAGIEFPVTKVAVNGGLRDHVHEYPHTHGGQPEKLGRKLYTIHMSVLFQSTFRAYPNLWPVSMAKLRKVFENQETQDLVIPTIGTMKCYCRNWPQEMDAKVQSGETASFEFVEDQSAKFVASALRASESMQAAFAKFDAKKALDDYKAVPKSSVFDIVQNAVNAVFAVKDMGDAGANLLAAKLIGLVDTCASVDRLATMQEPANADLVASLHALWASAQNLVDNTVGKQAPVRTYAVPRTMAISDVSTFLYGDTSHSIEMMQMNPIEDALRIPAGTVIRYYDPGSVGIAA